MPDRGRDVYETINEYIRPKGGTLTTMRRIHHHLTGENKDFTRWSDVEQEYMEMDWDDDSFTRFLEAAREFVEGRTEVMSETYFDITEPENSVSDVTVRELSERAIDEEDESPIEEGFSHRVRDDGVIEGTYHYSSISIEITAEPRIRRQPSPKSINFRVEPNNSLLIAETTYPAHIRKIQGVFNNKTTLNLEVCGDLTAYPDQADQRITSFINAFREEGDKISHE